MIREQGISIDAIAVDGVSIDGFWYYKDWGLVCC
jgi:hypothetical protein